MLAFAIRRLFEAAIVMVTVALIAFTLFRFVGDPVNQMVGQDTSLEDRLRLREELGLNDPIPVQFARFLTSAAQFDFGISYQMKQPVTAIIRDRFPATLELALTAALFAVALGIPMGVYTGIHRDSWLSKIFLTVSLIGRALPTFLIGILLLNVFAGLLGLQLGAIIAFAIITETVFQWPGMGLMFIQAVQNADIPVMSAYLMLVAFLFVFINFVVDLIYVRVDPRIRIFGRSS